jgi:hypothetical protein
VLGLEISKGVVLGGGRHNVVDWLGKKVHVNVEGMITEGGQDRSHLLILRCDG